MDKTNQRNCYPMLELSEMNRRMQMLETLWRDFLDFEGEQGLEYFVHKRNVFEVIKRQDQRMYYLKIFHGLEYPCEYKYLAVECFWINTLKPFMVVDEKSSLYDAPNEKFSLYLILSLINAVWGIYNPGVEFRLPTEERIRDILYDFKYCSLSREAMIAFVETFADTYGVGIEFILKEGDRISKALRENKLLKLFENTNIV